jgi:CelD/BcsL family acetyltransferase involved in cellulose biosynthesis
METNQSAISENLTLSPTQLLNFTVVRTLADFEMLGTGWNNLLEQSAIRVPFLRHEYLVTWWQTLGGGEWREAELFIIIARDNHGELVGIAPLFFTLTMDNIPTLMLLGSFEISDYLDVIVRTADHTRFLEGLLEFLLTQTNPGWKTLELYNLLENSPTLAHLPSIAEKQNLIFDSQILQPAPLLTLRGDWESYLAGIDKKQRHEIRRKIRRAEGSELPVNWYIVTDEATLDAEIEAFLALMGQDTTKQAFLTAAMRTQLRISVHAAFRAGWLQLAFLEVDGHKAAGYLNFDYGDHIWVYNSGLDYTYGALSPGWVLLAYLIEWAITHGRSSFDFMRGDEDYKYRFGGVNQYVMRARLTK